MISILVPTRKRPDKMQTLIDSIEETTHDLSKVELIFYIDEDDDDSLSAMTKTAELSIKHIIGPRILLSKTWNKCYEIARGDIIMHGGDDIVFRTPKWDVEVENAFNQYDDKIVLVYGRDGFQDEKLATHGFVHRRWIETVGYFLPPFFSSDYNDTWLFELDTNIKRTHYLDSILIEHMHYVVGKSEYDETYKEREARGEEDNVKELYTNLAPLRGIDTAKLLEAIAPAGSQPIIKHHPVPFIPSLREYIQNPTTENMWKVGVEYEEKNQTASAIGFYHQCAERAIDNELLTYECLLRMALCYEKQGDRKAHEKNSLLMAIGVLPHRPEAYFLLCKVLERTATQVDSEKWWDCYTYASIGNANEHILLSDDKPLRTDCGYIGGHFFRFQQAVCLWWLGRCDEARVAFNSLSLKDYDNFYKEIIENNRVSLESNEGRRRNK